MILLNRTGHRETGGAYDAAVTKEGLKEIQEKFGYLGFGTQSASIVARFSKDANIKLHILVVPDGDDETNAGALLKQLEENTKTGTTVFDNESAAKKFATYLIARESGTWFDKVNQYVKNSGVKIVKAEFASPRSGIRFEINKKFSDQNAAGKIPTVEQQKNMDMAYSLVSEKMENSWCALPRDNPNVLFMFPAGHTGIRRELRLLAGNADADEALPASCENRYQNVLTSTSVNDDGSLVSSSDYGVTIDIAGVEKQPGFLPTGKEYETGGTCAIGNALTGVAAAIWSEHPEYTPGQVKNAVLLLGSPLESLKSKVAAASYITRETLSHYDRFSHDGVKLKAASLETGGAN